MHTRFANLSAILPDGGDPRPQLLEMGCKIEEEGNGRIAITHNGWYSEGDVPSGTYTIINDARARIAIMVFPDHISFPGPVNPLISADAGVHD
jgi:hypothetical protein